MRLTSKDSEIARQWIAERDRISGSASFLDGRFELAPYKGADIFVTADVAEGNKMLARGIALDNVAAALAARVVAREHGATATQRALVNLFSLE